MLRGGGREGTTGSRKLSKLMDCKLGGSGGGAGTYKGGDGGVAKMGWGRGIEEVLGRSMVIKRELVRWGWVGLGVSILVTWLAACTIPLPLSVSLSPPFSLPLSVAFLLAHTSRLTPLDTQYGAICLEMRLHLRFSGKHTCKHQIRRLCKRFLFHMRSCPEQVSDRNCVNWNPSSMQYLVT